MRKGRESACLLCAAALLVLGTCAYLGVFLYEGLAALRQAPLPAFAEEGYALWGVAVRRERVIEPIPGAASGKRLRGLGVYFSACDGWESISPEALEDMRPAALAALAESGPESVGAARLVEDSIWYYAALLQRGDCPAPGPCRLRFAGFPRSVPARLLEVRQEDGQTLLLFRLTEGGAYLNIRLIEAEIERS